ncbi:MAG: hypothetical protein ACJAS1_005189 [Oleiphilaceae bacterium]|jgi:hypothetical protein
MAEFKFKNSTTTLLVIFLAISIGVLTGVIGMTFIDNNKLFEPSELKKIAVLFTVELLFIIFIAKPAVRKLIIKNRKN